MKCLLLLAALCAVALSYKQKTTKCYQCAWSPPKTTYHEVKTPREVKYKVKVADSYGYGKTRYEWKTRTEYDVKQVAQTVNGGWDKCGHPFSHHEAKSFGIDVWDCPGHCYTKTDNSGNVYRGCFEGAWGVDQNKFGCSQQNGAWWCFCKGDKCNNN